MKNKIQITFTVENSKDFKRLAKADDMASFIFELVNNGWREFKHTSYDYQPSWDKINSLLQEHNIIIEDLIE